MSTASFVSAISSAEAIGSAGYISAETGFASFIGQSISLITTAGRVTALVSAISLPGVVGVVLAVTVLGNVYILSKNNGGKVLLDSGIGPKLEIDVNKNKDQK